MYYVIMMVMLKKLEVSNDGSFKSNKFSSYMLI